MFVGLTALSVDIMTTCLTPHSIAASHIDFVPKIKLELVIKDELYENALDIVLKVARTGKIGDGKIFVRNIGDAIRIRTGENGDEAL